MSFIPSMIKVAIIMTWLAIMLLSMIQDLQLTGNRNHNETNDYYIQHTVTGGNSAVSSYNEAAKEMGLATNYITQVSTASVSFVTSATIVGMICFSKKKLSSPYRRLLFSLSSSDIIVSIALVTGPFSVPRDAPFALWAHGNVGTCDLNGILLSAGSGLVNLYMLLLCYYYLCKLKYGMTDQHFKRIEVYFHAGAILYTLVCSLAAAFLHTFNATPLAGICYYYVYPYGCNIKGSSNFGQCTRGEDFEFFVLCCGIAVSILCLLGIIVCMILLSIHASEKTREHRRQSIVVKNTQPKDDSIFSSVVELTPTHITNNNPIQNNAVYNQHKIVVRHLSRLYMKETITQAALFVLGFILVKIVPLIVLILGSIGKLQNSIGDGPIPILLSSTYPLGGLVNILIYCRPKVNALRRQQAGLSWIGALFHVIRAGGEIPKHLPEHLCCCSNVKENSDSKDVNKGNGASNLAGVEEVQNPPHMRRNGSPMRRNDEFFLSNENYSHAGMDGQSLSFGESHVGHRDSEQWDYLAGDSNISRYAESMGYLPQDESFNEFMHAREINFDDSDLSIESLSEVFEDNRLNSQNLSCGESYAGQREMGISE